MKIAILYGSSRRDRQGIKAAKFISNKLEEKGFETTIVDSMEYNLPFLDLMHKEYEKGKAPEAMETIHNILEHADGFVIVSAEYNHSIPAALKNLLDHFQGEYYFKPSAIVSYSAGGYGGLRVAMHLRAVLAELGMPSIPTIFPISDIYNSIDEKGNATDDFYNQRVGRFIDELKWYANALKEQRKIGLPY